MQNNYNLYKNNDSDIISWVDNIDSIGEWMFTFDGITFYNLFEDYPQKLTKEQKELFDKENPYWMNFFKERQ